MTYRSVEEIKRDSEFAENRIEILKADLIDIHKSIKQIDSQCRRDRAKLAEKLSRDISGRLHFTALSFSPAFGRNKCAVYVYMRIYFTKSDLNRSRQIAKGKSGKGYSEEKIKRYIEEWEYDLVLQAYRRIRVLEKLAAAHSGNILNYQKVLSLHTDMVALAYN